MYDLVQSALKAVYLHKQVLARNSATNFKNLRQQRPEYNEGMRVYSQPVYIGDLQNGFSSHNQGLCTVSSLYFNLGLLYLQSEEDDHAPKAEKYFSKALDFRLRATVATNVAPTVIALLHNVGYVYYRNHRLSEARNAFENALKFSVCVHEYFHPSTVVSLNCLGVIFLRGQGREQISRAHHSLREAMLIRSKLPDIGEDAYYATLLNNLGRAHFLLSEFNEALVYYEQARSIRLRLLGPRHIDIAATICNLAQVHHRLGNSKKAVRLYLEFVDITKSFGSCSSDIAYAYRSLAEIFQEDKELEKSKDYYYRALEYFKLSVGEKSVEVSNVLNKIGNILCETQDLDAALVVYEQGLKVERQICSSLHDSNMIVTLANIVRIHLSQERWDEALAPCAEVLCIQQLQNNPNQIDIASTLCSVAFIYDKRGEIKQAIESYKEALLIKRTILGDDHFDVSSILNALGLIYFKMSSWKEALVNFRECLTIRKSSKRSTSKDVSSILYNTAAVYAEIGMFQESILYYKECIDIERSDPNTKTSDVLSTFNRLGHIYKQVGDYRNAVNTYLGALVICKDKPENIYDVSRLLSQAGTCYAHLGEHENAVSAFDSASECLRIAGLTNETDLTNDLYAMYYLTYVKNTPSCAAAA